MSRKNPKETWMGPQARFRHFLGGTADCHFGKFVNFLAVRIKIIFPIPFADAGNSASENYASFHGLAHSLGIYRRQCAG
jgi:hypothetical protein